MMSFSGITRIARQYNLLDQAKGRREAIIDAIMPSRCINCSVRTGHDMLLCADCWSKLEFIEPPYCRLSGVPFAYDPGEGIVSAAALADPPLWERARAATCFNDMSRRLIHMAKYYDRHEAALLMAEMMTRAGRHLVGDDTIIIPVPLHRYRLWKRRYNQSAILARRFAENTGASFRPELLVRQRSTRQQVGLKTRERRRNVKGAFQVPDEVASELFGAHVILIDDVITTGATLAACTAALKNVTCKQVDVLAFSLVHDAMHLHI